MIYVRRSVDSHQDVAWIVGKMEGSRVGQLYAGKDVNEAIAVAVKHGMASEDAVAEAQREIERCKGVVDDIAPKKTNGILIHSER